MILKKLWCREIQIVPIIDASMRYLKLMGLDHNRFKNMVTSYILTKKFINRVEKR